MLDLVRRCWANKGAVTQQHRVQLARYVFDVERVCVSQQDLAERGRQVQRMADVYRLASRVVIWVGEGTHDSDLAMSTLKRVSSKVNYDHATFHLSSICEDPLDAHV